MKKQLLLVIVLGFLGVFLGCTEDDSPAATTATMIYYQTYCSDPWEQTASEDSLSEKVIQYFATEGIVIAQVQSDTEGPIETCLACSCKTGTRILVSVSNENVSAMENYGFTLQE